MKIPFNSNNNSQPSDPKKEYQDHPEGTFQAKITYVKEEVASEGDFKVRVGFRTAMGTVFTSYTSNPRIRFKLVALANAVGQKDGLDTSKLKDQNIDIRVKHVRKVSRADESKTVLFYDVEVHPPGTLVQLSSTPNPVQNTPPVRPPIPPISSDGTARTGWRYREADDTPF